MKSFKTFLTEANAPAKPNPAEYKVGDKVTWYDSTGKAEHAHVTEISKGNVRIRPVGKDVTFRASDKKKLVKGHQPIKEETDAARNKQSIAAQKVQHIPNDDELARRVFKSWTGT
jgi:hypothetical protein